MAAAEELLNLLGGAFAPLAYDWTGMAVTRAIVKLGVAKLVPLMGLNTTATAGAERCAINASSPSTSTDAGLISMSSLAASAGLPEPLLRRLLRHAMTRHVFREPREGFVAHTAASAALARVASPPREAFQFAAEDLWPAGLRLADAIAKWPTSEEPTESGFAVAHAEEGEGGQELKSLWQVLQLDAAKARRFGGMVELEASFVGFPLHQAEWSGTVVDVGGGSGAVSVDLARRFPDARFIVQDLASVIQGREAEVPSDVKGRVQFMAHDLFSEQPVVGADIYFLRWICHDWSSKYAIQIIRNLIPALKHGARVRLNEGLMPRPGTFPRRLERAIR
ncbi:O-methyltransferase family 2 [Macrophomina phaseolina MS6]|uniref:O-methyltransferase family 2 n=1 Tax=Macrophomina phaseolina (strain MS6) TaxID=1126212 RepID=K2RN75_MACPH|nr:O-methyltransferase family 2 [Macrophomina phaseolina MS6]